MRTAVILLVAVFGGTLGAWPETARADDEPAAAAYDPVDDYVERQVEGWRVLVNKRLLADEQQALCDRTMRILDDQLFRITLRVPKEPLEKLAEIPIWVELAHPLHPCMCYHPSPDWLREHDMNPEKAKGVEIANAQNFTTWTLQQPWMVLHELAHGYHDRVLGFEHAEIKKVFEEAQASKSYETVLRINDRTERHYALTNQMEYFAEATEAYFGTNDFYPFVRAELKQHDPKMFALLEDIWAGAGDADAAKPDIRDSDAASKRPAGLKRPE